MITDSKQAFVLESEERSPIIDFEGTEIISVNGRDKLEELQGRYPNIEIVIGKATSDDKPVKMDLLEMEHDRNRVIDAATETVLGKRIDKLDKPVRFPLPAVTFVLGAMASAFSVGIFQHPSRMALAASWTPKNTGVPGSSVPSINQVRPSA